MSKFEIDFFELMFLAESVIPKRPIARSMCFDSFSEVHYHKMSDNERQAFFDHVTSCHGFDLNNEQCAHFYARFKYNNQYRITTLFNGEQKVVDAYLYNGNFHVKQNQFIEKNYIIKTERI